MADAAEIWAKILPQVKESVTGVGVWAALNACKPVTLEEGVLVLGIPHEDSELSGHLRMPQTKRLMEIAATEVQGSPIAVRVIDGTALDDWETLKRRDKEKQRLEGLQRQNMRAEMEAKTSWETVYEQLSRRYAAVTNKSLPQNRARFFEEAVDLIAEARNGMAAFDDLGERNFARCLERLAQYSEVPSTLVAASVLKRAGEL